MLRVRRLRMKAKIIEGVLWAINFIALMWFFWFLLDFDLLVGGFWHAG